jgi:hypothetical protein
VVVAGLAHRALAAADPGVDEPSVADLHPAGLRTQFLDHAVGLVTRGERRHAAAVLHVEALSASQVEEAFPYVKVRVADPRSRDPDQDLGALGLRGLADPRLQGFAVFDDFVAQHVDLLV